MCYCMYSVDIAVHTQCGMYAYSVHNVHVYVSVSDGHGSTSFSPLFGIQ